jgi:hypothetical protein
MRNKKNALIFMIIIIVSLIGCITSDTKAKEGEIGKDNLNESKMNKKDGSMIFWIWIPCKTKSGYYSVDTKWGIMKITYDSLHIVPEQPKDKNDNTMGIIHNLADDVSITNIKGSYPNYIVSIKNYAQFGKVDDKGNIKLTKKWIYGEIIIHFINENEIWFESKLDEEFNKRVSYLIKFGPEHTYKKAEVLKKHIKSDAP